MSKSDLNKGEELTPQSRIYQLKHDTEHVQISAHGGPVNLVFGESYPTWKVPNDLWIVFYGPHKVPLLNPGFARIFRLSPRPYEIYGPGSDCPNYGLWKWQGYHDTFSGVMLGFLAKPFSKVKNQSETYEQLKKAINEADKTRTTQSDNGRELGKNSDIITIRYRPGWIHTTLKDIVDAVVKNKRKYRYVHCNFCRGVIGGHDIDDNKKRTPTFFGTRFESQWWY